MCFEWQQTINSTQETLDVDSLLWFRHIVTRKRLKVEQQHKDGASSEVKEKNEK